MIRKKILPWRDGYKAKYLYFKGKTSEVISRVNELRKTHKPISRSLYDQLERFSIEAFDGAVNGYSEGTLEFKEYSTWCIETEQFLTSLGFFDLKAKLINIYLNGVMKRVGFALTIEKLDSSSTLYEIWYGHIEIPVNGAKQSIMPEITIRNH